MEMRAFQSTRILVVLERRGLLQTQRTSRKRKLKRIISPYCPIGAGTEGAFHVPYPAVDQVQQTSAHVNVRHLFVDPAPLGVSQLTATISAPALEDQNVDNCASLATTFHFCIELRSSKGPTIPVTLKSENSVLTVERTLSWYSLG
jgi:hypothetical protein